MGKATNELRVSGIMDRALKDGDSLPSFELPNRKGEMFSSAELLQRGNLVLTFYRGVW
jgi:peroxiredoxin